MDVNEDEKVELRCTAQGIPTPVISWQLVSGGVLPTGGREYTVSNSYREYLYSAAVYQKYLTRLGELIIFEPCRENYHFSQPS